MAGEDRPYIRWLHTCECACQPCAARPDEIQASHPRTVKEAPSGKRLGGRPGKGQRADDTRAYPVCWKHHGQAQRYEFAKPNSFFFGWDRKKFAAWELEMGTKYRALYEAQLEPVTEGQGAPRTVVRHPDGFDVQAAIEELVVTYQGPEGGQLRFDLKRFARNLQDAVERGRAF